MIKSDKIREYFRTHPEAEVSKVAAKFKTSKSMVYKLRNQVLDEWQPPELLPVPDPNTDAKPARKVTLTRSQREIANMMGVSLKSYVKEGLALGVLKYDDEVAEQGTEWQPTKMLPMPDLGTTEVDQVLRERGNRYGTFEDNAKTCQLLKNVLHAQEGWYRLSYVQREAVGMMMFKISRLINGDPTYIDTVVDIAGYNQLMLEHMRDRNEGKEVE